MRERECVLWRCAGECALQMKCASEAGLQTRPCGRRTTRRLIDTRAGRWPCREQTSTSTDGRRWRAQERLRTAMLLLLLLMLFYCTSTALQTLPRMSTEKAVCNGKLRRKANVTASWLPYSCQLLYLQRHSDYPPPALSPLLLCDMTCVSTRCPYSLTLTGKRPVPGVTVVTVSQCYCSNAKLTTTATATSFHRLRHCCPGNFGETVGSQWQQFAAANMHMNLKRTQAESQSTQWAQVLRLGAPFQVLHASEGSISCWWMQKVPVSFYFILLCECCFLWNAFCFPFNSINTQVICRDIGLY